MAASKGISEAKAPRRPPATTPQARENQLSALAYDLAEEQLRDKTASAQVILHFLKESSVTAQLQREKTILEQELLKVRVEATASNSRLEDLTQNAIDAFKTYSGQDENDAYLG